MDLQFNRLTQLSFGYWHSQPVFALLELGIPELLAQTVSHEQGLTPEDVCTHLGIHVAAGCALLNACVALGLLKMQQGTVRNAELTSRYLVRSSPESMVHWLRVMGRWSRPWTDLADAVRTGTPAESQALRLGQDPAYLRDFILGMHEYARRSSTAVVDHFGLEAATTLVDVGGGAGTFSLACCERFSQLKVRLLDLPPVLEIAANIIEGQRRAKGTEYPITLDAHDYRRDPFGRDQDAILFSNVLHQESADIASGMLERAHDALRIGGKVLVHGHFLEDERTAPLFTTLHNLSARVLWEGGGSYTGTEMVELMRQAGFHSLRKIQIKASATLLIEGHK